MERVLVALSGGVDSSVAAALLKRRGYEVGGAIMVFEGIPCETVGRARAVAQHLNIPFYVFDFTVEFQRKIINNFIKEYKNGRTPNPCVLCNEYIKFNLFLKEAKRIGFTKIATGHYARIVREDGRYLLKKGRGRNEQSYFLYRLKQRQLSETVLPLAFYTKKKVRKIAGDLGLPSQQSKKSHDICFIPGQKYGVYLKKVLSEKRGPILNKQGDLLGYHRGTIFYTYGQRRGIGVSGPYPYFVVGIDAKKNILVIGTKKEAYSSGLIVRDLNFIPFDRLKKRLQVSVKVRYVSRAAGAVIEPLEKKRVQVFFNRRQWAPAPGQSAVFYQDGFVLGGGIIEKVIS